jgi:GH15 family glucan-1,4-alpha-glucosidase
MLYRLLDPEGGAVGVRTGLAGGALAGEQSYLPDTNVLRTVLGDVDVLDFMPFGEGRIVRVITARRGPVDVHVDVTPACAWRPARRVHAFATGIAFDGAVVRTGFPFEGRVATTRLEAGERVVVTIDGEDHEPLTVTAALDLAERTADTWRRYVSSSTYDGPYRDSVERSLLILKGLTYSESGAVVAAATTSLPEFVGGERNWDYRYAWVRDASLAIDAAYDAGLTEEGEQFVGWLHRVLGGTTFPVRPLFDVDGEPIGDDEVLLALPGWRGSQPVRVGNAASTHLQLDFYADVVGVLHAEQFRRRGSRVHELWETLTRMADWLCDAWRLPDRGMWEIRSEPRHLVSSKVSCWYALTRMTELALARNPLDAGSVAWRQAAREIEAWLSEHALAADGGLRQDTRIEDDPDGSLLTALWRGPWPHDDEVCRRTVDRVLSRLGDGPFVARYPPSADDGLPPGEGMFLPCSFWAVRALAILERWDEAHERMEQLLAFARPLGVLSEEADPRTGDYLGNLPQAFSHLALVDAALALAQGPR